VRQALTANEFGADVYLGFEATAEASAVIHYYRVPAFESVEGRSLAERIEDSWRTQQGDLGVRPAVSGVRLPVLRETRMPAVLVVLGPARAVSDRAPGAATTLRDAVAVWLAREA
jgi:N-acetylmuramoyl-L-alanine amidase